MQRYFASCKNDNIFILDDKDKHHILNVMRMKSNDHIEVVYDGVLYDCCLYLDNNFIVKCVSEIDSFSSNMMSIILIVPVLKEQKMDIVLQKATELGVDRIIPIITERCVVKVDGKEKNKVDRWSRIVKEASEQSKRINVPVIDNICKIDDLKFDDGVKLVCSTVEKQKKFKNIMQMHKNCDKMYIVVGPEGGLSSAEECKLNDLGFVSVSLGDRILRVETVPLFILSCINYEFLE